MKKVMLTSLLVLASSANATYALDRQTTDALVACQNYVWAIDKYSNLPNAAISVFPLTTDENSIITVWHIMWDDPMVRAAGNCTVIDGSVEDFENYAS